MILKILLSIYLLIFNLSCKKDIQKKKIESTFKVTSLVYFNKKLVFKPNILLQKNEPTIRVTMYDNKEMRYSIKLQEDKSNTNRFLLYTRIEYKNSNSDVLFILEINKNKKATLYTKRGDTFFIKVKIEKIYFRVSKGKSE